MSEIDATESELEFIREHDERRALEALSSLRVEVASPTRLVRRSNRRKPIGEAPRDTARPWKRGGSLHRACYQRRKSVYFLNREIRGRFALRHQSMHRLNRLRPARNR